MFAIYLVNANVANVAINLNSTILVLKSFYLLESKDVGETTIFGVLVVFTKFLPSIR